MSRCILLGAAMLLVGSAALAQPAASIEVTAVPLLLNCRNQACFQLLVNAYDAEGNPVGMPPDTRFSVFEEGTDREHEVFYESVAPPAGAAATPVQATIPRYALLLVDTSGSMREVLPGGQTKFEAARAAIERAFLANFQERTDRMAIVGFDSTRVRERIAAASFRRTRAEVDAELDTLRPSSGNTALYSAVSYALDKVQATFASEASRDAQILVIVFTDGQNDVRPERGDDPGMLAGDEGLVVVAGKARRLAGELPLSIVTIGFGQSGQTFDEVALQRLKFPEDADHYHNAKNPEELEQIFRRERQAQTSRLSLVVGPVRSSKDHLVNTPLRFIVREGDLSARSPRFEPPAIGSPPWSRSLNDAEQEAFEQLIEGRGQLGDPSWRPLVMRLLVFVVYAAALAILWLALPRLIWPERYAPRPAFQALAPVRSAGRPTAATRGGGQRSVTIASRTAPRSARDPSRRSVAAGGPAPRQESPGQMFKRGAEEPTATPEKGRSRE